MCLTVCFCGLSLGCFLVYLFIPFVATRLFIYHMFMFVICMFVFYVRVLFVCVYVRALLWSCFVFVTTFESEECVERWLVVRAPIFYTIKRYI